MKAKIGSQPKKQLAMFGTYEFPSYEEIIEAYSREFPNYVTPKGDTTFGFWMQTLCRESELSEITKYLLNKYLSLFTDEFLPAERNKESYLADIIQVLCASEA